MKYPSTLFRRRFVSNKRTEGRDQFSLRNRNHRTHFMIDIPAKINDNLDYIRNVEFIFKDLIAKWTPSDLYITRVDNWFDDKWVKFSGTIMHEISIHNLDDVTVPPFHPNRIEKTDFYRRKNRNYEKQEAEKTLHILQQSTSNLKRKISNFSNNGLFLWYSGNTITNHKGSIMGYLVTNEECFTFYVTLARQKNWNAEKAIGLTTKEIQRILTG